jgi:hypothetical protein
MDGRHHRANGGKNTPAAAWCLTYARDASHRGGLHQPSPDRVNIRQPRASGNLSGGAPDGARIIAASFPRPDPLL